MSEIPKIHDKFFKTVFSYKSEMQELIKQTFPSDIVDNIDFNSLERDETEYLNSKLEEHFSDLIYNCVYKKTTKIKIVLLFEHKSYIEKYIHFQILAYILNIWEKSTKKDNLKPLIVIPIVFYHGLDNWNYQSMEKYFDNVDDNLRKYIPTFDYILINTKQLDDTKLLTDFKESTSIAIFLLKYIFDKKSLQTKIVDFFARIENLIIQNIDRELYITFYLYLKQNLKSKDMETIIENAEKKYSKNIFIQTFYEEIREEERKRHSKLFEKQENLRKIELIEQEKQKLDLIKKMILKNFSNEDIIYFLDCNVSEIEQIRMELKSS